MDIIERAKELGTMIRNSEEMANMKRTEENVYSDEKAKTLLHDFSTLREEMVKALQEDRDKGEIEEIKKILISKQDEINNYEITRNYLEANQKLDSLMKQINDVISFAITGEEPSCSSHGCGGGCSGCK